MARSRVSVQERVGVVGLDLSLRNAAAVYIPPEWEPGDWHVPYIVVHHESVPADDHRGRVERSIDIAEKLAQWVSHTTPRTRVFVEDYAYGAGQARAHEVAETIGLVKAQLFRLSPDCLAIPLNQSTVRKYLLGKLPKKDRGAAVAAALKKAGAPWEQSDIGDAFVVANYGRTEVGLPGLVLG